ncbi:MAG TPA: ComF family protein [Gammaproteobacteria bacterium]|nr:ComF family protein [Gammaproteobacteria bacterium]
MKWLKTACNWLLPPLCALCRNPTTNAALCTLCLDELPWIKNACPRCARPLMGENRPCGNCLRAPPLYQILLAPFAYKPPLDHLVLALKFGNQFTYAEILGNLLATVVADYYPQNYRPELIIPVPLHPQRLRERGYNQALEIARPLHKKLHIPLSIHQCQRQIATQPQALIPANERKRNMRQVFSINSPILASHVAIVDDVVTTGTTVGELARVLQKAGAQKIDIWCCARTEFV